MSTTFDVFYLGTGALIDPTEGNNTSENAAALVGQTYGGTGDPLFNHVQTFSPGSYSGGNTTMYDSDNNLSNDTFRIDGGALQTFDAIVVYNATITYYDGTTATITANVIQDTAGRLYLAPELFSNTDQTALQAAPIRSLTLNSINTASGDFTADRYAASYYSAVDGTAGADSMGVGYTDAQGDQITTGNDYVIAGAGNDTIDAGAGNDTIEGGDGNDVIVAGAGNDRISGGEGDDTFTFSGTWGADTVYGDAWDGTGTGNNDILDFSAVTAAVTVTFTTWEDGTATSGTNSVTFDNIEHIIGGSGNDTIDASLDGSGLALEGGAGNDSIIGGSGADTIIGGTGNDSLSGGAGNDIFDLTGGGTDTIDGGAGYDIIDARGITTEPYSVTFTNIEEIYASDTGGSWYWNGGSASILFHGGTGNDSVLAGAGNDTIYGGTGDDTISGGGGADLVYGGTGDDVIGTTSSNDDGNDTFYGDAGNDTIIGGGGDDLIYGGTGDDYLQGYYGNDTLDGGDGSDTFGVADEYDSTTIIGGEGGTDSDVLSLWSSASTAGVTVTFTGDEAGTYDFVGTTGSGSFTQIEAVWSTQYDDLLDASASTVGQSLAGNSGNDTLIGGSGRDWLDGGDGNDSIVGNDGGDWILGGTGDDTLTGGAGDDRFSYFAGDGNDVITDFNTGNTGTLLDGDSTNNDFIDLSGYYDTLWELWADQADDGILNQSNNGVNGVDYSNNTQFGTGSLTFTGASADNTFFTVENTGVTCYLAGTRILTPSGEVEIEQLRVGDLVLTSDHGAQPIRWIGVSELPIAPAIAPIRISKGALGAGLPQRDLFVSPQHRMLVRSRIVARMTGVTVGLVAAKKLTALPGIERVETTGRLSYYHLICDAHEIIFAEGAPSETLLPGPQARRAMSAAAWAELSAIFPELTAEARHPTPARPILHGPLLRRLLERHRHKATPLVHGAAIG